MSKSSESEEQRQRQVEKIEGSKEEGGDGKVEEMIIRVQDDAKECKTPPGSCNQIAATTTCPPAPRKRRPTSLSYYKRASFTANDRFNFFEDATTQEVKSEQERRESEMAPKRTQKLVVQTTRRVVQESVEVSVAGSSKRSTRGSNKEENVRAIPIPIEEVTPQDGQNEKVQEAKTTKTKRKRGSRVGEHYQRYVYMVLKQVHADMGISSKAMTILNNLMTDMFERLADEAARLTKYTGHMTLSSRGREAGFAW